MGCENLSFGRDHPPYTEPTVGQGTPEQTKIYSLYSVVAGGVVTQTTFKH